MRKIAIGLCAFCVFCTGMTFGDQPDYHFVSGGHCLVISEKDCREMSSNHVLVVYYDALANVSLDDVVGPMYSGNAWKEVKRVALRDDIWAFIYRHSIKHGKKSVARGLAFQDNFWVLNAEGKKDTVPATFSFLNNGPVEWVEHAMPRAVDETEDEEAEDKGPKIENFFGFECKVVGGRHYLTKDPSIEILPNGVAVREDRLTKVRIRVNPDTGEELDRRPEPRRRNLGRQKMVQ